MIPKKKIVELSKKKVEEELQKQKDVLEERSPLEKAKQAYKEELGGTSPEKEKIKSESVPKKKPPTKVPEATTGDISKMVDKSYDQLQRTTRGLGAAASVFLGESLGVDTTDDPEDSSTDSKLNAADLARKILERKKRKTSDE
jgi:hypothetical protein